MAIAAGAESATERLVGPAGVFRRNGEWVGRGALGFDLEWVGLPPDEAAGAVARLTRRVRSGAVAALIVLDALIDGPLVTPLALAAGEVRLPVALAGTGTEEAIRRALVELDLRIAGEPRVER